MTAADTREAVAAEQWRDEMPADEYAAALAAARSEQVDR